MIDTIKLMIPLNSVKILNPEYFTPNFNISKFPLKQVSEDGFFSCDQLIPPDHIRKRSLHKLLYFPRLKIKRINTRGMLDDNGNKMSRFLEFLKIEFSIPKLLFQNNFEEVTTGDIDRIIEILIERLIQMGVLVTSEAILGSKVIGVHFGKNIIIDEYADCYFLLKAVSQADITNRLEFGQTEYRNDGHLVRFRANNHELCFYDKVKDLESAINKAKSRSIEQDQEIQADMIKKLKDKQILRMEVRINDMKKYSALCKVMNINPPVKLFEYVFDLNIAKKICNYYFDILMAGMKFVMLNNSDMQMIFENLYNQKQWSESKVMSTLGALCISNLYGSRFLKQYSTKKYADIKMLFKEINFTESYTSKIMKQVQKELRTFAPIRFDSWEKAEQEKQNKKHPFDLDKINIFG